MAKPASSGHKLGQVIGDWYEEYFAYPILKEVAKELGLYLDCRFKERNCRGEKIIWRDLDGNDVDYDFVMELGGTKNKLGSPVAFFETFWRRGSRHSKDKARDDSGKLMPMKATYPTARILGVISAGDFTGPARELVQSRGIDLFYVEKQKILDAWSKHGLNIDYPDKSSEKVKSKVATPVIKALKKDPKLYRKIAKTLIKLANKKSIEAYGHRLIGKIGAIPQKYSIQLQSKAQPIRFNLYAEVDNFLSGDEPSIEDYEQTQFYGYKVDFSDGDEFLRDNLNWQELKEMHLSLKTLITAME